VGNDRTFPSQEAWGRYTQTQRLSTHKLRPNKKVSSSPIDFLADIHTEGHSLPASPQSTLTLSRKYRFLPDLRTSIWFASISLSVTIWSKDSIRLAFR